MKLLLPVLPLFAAFSVQAHPGHGLGALGAGHVLTSPYHLAILFTAGLALWIGGRFIHRELPRRILRGAGIAAVLTATAILGSRL